MRPAAEVRLQPGRVYRTRWLARWTANPTRTAKRLVDEGRLKPVAHGLFYAPRPTRFGTAPPDAHELMRALLGDDDYVFTGPDAWNALGLGTTAVMPVQLVYNRKRSGEFELGSQRFVLRRVAFPKRPAPEWFVVDLLENLVLTGADAASVERNLASALSAGRFDLVELRSAAGRYGTQRTRDLVERAANAQATA